MNKAALTSTRPRTSNPCPPAPNPLACQALRHEGGHEKRSLGRAQGDDAPWAQQGRLVLQGTGGG